VDSPADYLDYHGELPALRGRDHQVTGPRENILLYKMAIRRDCPAILPWNFPFFLNQCARWQPALVTGPIHRHVTSQAARRPTTPSSLRGWLRSRRCLKGVFQSRSRARDRLWANGAGRPSKVGDGESLTGSVEGGGRCDACCGGGTSPRSRGAGRSRHRPSVMGDADSTWRCAPFAPRPPHQTDRPGVQLRRNGCMFHQSVAREFIAKDDCGHAADGDCDPFAAGHGDGGRW